MTIYANRQHSQCPQNPTNHVIFVWLWDRGRRGSLSVRPCDRDTFGGFGISVLTLGNRDIYKNSVGRVIEGMNCG